jgi:hypothetical protein
MAAIQYLDLQRTHAGLGQFANFKRAGFLKQAMEPGMPTGRGIKGSHEGFPLLRIENKAASISQRFVRTG